MTNILFVCLGNICRSPMAEAIFQHLIEGNKLEKEFYCDSAGTANYHIGDSPDYRTIKVLKEKGISTHHLGRQFSKTDFKKFDIILAMDRANYQNIISLALTEEDKKKVHLMREFDSIQPNSEVPDPYYGNMQDFEKVYEMLLRCNTQLLETISSN